MRKLLNYISCAVITFIVGIGVYAVRHSTVEVVQIDNTTVAQPVLATPVTDSPELQTAKTMQLSDLLTTEDSLKYNGYLIRKAMKTYTFDDMDGYRSDQGYVVISRGATQFRSFDAGFYHPAGNRAAFGLFSFLGTQSQQVVISQDISRGGAQWIVDLSSTPRVIFDGPAWGVGRESDDCEVQDVDGDGIFEISLPITDFYALMDKVGMAGIPLPMIMQYFNGAYNLDDKKEIERRVQEILRDQPVYKYIYKQ